MKTHTESIGRFLLGLSVLVLLALFTLPAQAEIGTKSFGITNSIGANATHISAANVGDVVKIDNRDSCGLQFQFQGSGAGTDNITLTFARSVDGTTFETTPRFTWVVAQNGTTAVVGYTNLSTTVIGAAGYLKVVSIQNASATLAMTNCSLRLIEKSTK